MRLDLRLQRLPLAFALLLLDAQPLVHQVGRLGDHVVEAVGQLPELRARRDLTPHVQISLLHAPHRLRQPADGVGDGHGQLQREDQRQHQRRRRDEQIGLVDPVPAAQQLLRIGDAHGGPARRLRRAGDVESAAAPVAEEHPAVFGREHLLGVLLLQPRVDEILLRVPEDAARPVDEVDIAPAAQLDIRAEPVDDLIVEVDQQHALHLPCRVEHGLGKGDDPVVLPRDQIFHAGRRDLDLIRVRQRVHVPVRRVIIGIGIERRALASEQRPARLRDERDGGDLRADLLCGGQLLLCAAAGRVGQPVLVRRLQIGRDRAVVDDEIRNVLHIVHVHLELRVDAQDELLGVVRGAIQQLARRDADGHIGHHARDDQDQQHEQRRDPRADRMPGKELLLFVHFSASLYCFGVMPVRRRKVSEK